MSKILIGRSDVDLDYPVCRPSLDLDFTQEELDPRITFTRGSIGTRVNRNRLIETVDANQPRFDYDPVTGECKGLLIEESRSNLVTYSDDTNSYSNIDFSTVTTNQITAPDGTLTGDVLTSTKTGGSNNCWVQKVQTVSANTSTYVMSVFLKAGNTTQSLINLQLAGGTYQQSRATINWTTNTISSGDGTATLTAYPNGWYRASLTLTNNGTNTGVYPRVYVKSQGTNNINGEYVYIWGWQVEVGAFPTSYIPTDSTPGGKTRTADLASMTGTNFSSWYNSSEGTVYIDTYRNILSSYTTTPFSFNDGTSTNRINFRQDSTTLLYALIVRNNIFTGISSVVLSSFSIRIAASLTSNILKTSIRGTTSSTNFNGGLPSVTKMDIGNLTGVQYYNGSIRRLTYYPRALKPNQLQYLTQ
jgi:hypothetical protein